MALQQHVAEWVYMLLGGETLPCPELTPGCISCVVAVFCTMLTFIYVVHQRAAAQLASINADKNVLYQEIKQLRNLSYEMIDSMVAEESEESLPNDSQLVQCDSSDSCKSLDLSRHAQYVRKLATLFENQCECRLMGRSLPSLPSLQSSIPS
ncbi:hypothetical protein ACHWQZ_G009673 [Mnemiopsis leidyi]